LEFHFVAGNYSRSGYRNSEFLEELIRVFVVNSRIPPSNLIFVMAENNIYKRFSYTISTKIASSGSCNQRIVAKRSKRFVEHIPFDNVVSKTYPLKEG